MLKKTKLSFYLIITIFLTFGLTVSLQSLLAAVWSGPTDTPPDDNKPAPIWGDSDTNQVIKKATPPTAYNPSEMLEIYDTSNGVPARLRITDLGENAELQLYDNAGHWSIFTDNINDNQLKIWRGVTRMIIDDDTGNVSIGVNPGSAKLNVEGDIIATGGNSSEWNTAYDQKQQWSGGSLNLVAATGRTSLGLTDMATQDPSNVSITGGTINGLSSLSVSGTLTIPTGALTGRVLTASNNSGVATWQALSEVDGIIGNEIVNAANSTLSRSGLGTAASPWLLSLNTNNSNTWTQTQTFSPPSGNEGIRIITASNWSPLNIVGSAGDIFRVNQTGRLEAGIIPWARLDPSTIPSGLSDGDNQQLGRNLNTITLTNGGSVIAPYADTANALSANRANCSGVGEFAKGIDATGAAEGCAVPTGSDNQQLGRNLNTITLTNGGSVIAPYADTANALSANRANCSAGLFAAGVDATGAAEGCAKPLSTCPGGYVDAGTYCFEPNNRNGGWVSPGYNIWQASSGCFSEGMELCTFMQLVYACQRFSAGTDLKAGDKEHVFYDGAGDYSAWMDDGTCAKRATGQGVSTELPYRCCYTK